MIEQQSLKTFIKIAGMDIPVHLAWKKIEVLNTAADHLDRLNEEYPHLSTKFSCEILPIVRQRLRDSVSDVAAPKRIDDNYIDFLKEQIKSQSPEDCIDNLRSAYNVDINLSDLIYHVGEDNYIDAMIREAELYRDNKISPDQTAELWNDLQRPAPGKTHWTTTDVENLLD